MVNIMLVIYSIVNSPKRTEINANNRLITEDTIIIETPQIRVNKRYPGLKDPKVRETHRELIGENWKKLVVRASIRCWRSNGNC